MSSVRSCCKSDHLGHRDLAAEAVDPAQRSDAAAADPIASIVNPLIALHAAGNAERHRGLDGVELDVEKAHVT